MVFLSDIITETISRKRIDPTLVTEDWIKSEIQRCFQAAYRSNIHEMTRMLVMSLNERLLDVFVNAQSLNGGIEYTLKSLQYAMEFAYKFASENVDSQIVTLQMIANVSLSLLKYNIPEMLESVIRLCEEVHQFDVTSIRIHACCLIGFIFKVWNVLRKMDRAVSGEKHAKDGSNYTFSEDQMRTLFKILCERRRDRCSLVRIQVLIALSFAQKIEIGWSEINSTPRKFIVLHLRDRNYQCRQIAVDVLEPNCKDEIEVIAKLAFHDRSKDVRVAAINKLVRLPILALECRQRLEIVQSLLGTNDLSALKLLFDNCLAKRRNRNVKEDKDTHLYELESITLLEFFPPLDDEKTVHELLIRSLHYVRFRSLKHNFIDFLKDIFACDDHFMINASNISMLLNGNLSTNDLANAFFFAHCLLAFSKSEAKGEGYWSQCQYFLLPNLEKYCELIQRMHAQNKEKYRNRDEKLYLFAIKYAIKLISFIDISDIQRRTTWRAILDSILMDCSVSASPDLVECCVQQLFKYFWPRDEDIEIALFGICDIINQIAFDANPNQSILAGNETTLLLDFSSETRRLAEVIPDRLLLQCILIIHSMLNTKRFTTMHAILRGICDHMIDKAAVCGDLNIRRPAFEAMGMLARYDHKVAFEVTVIIKMMFNEVEDLQVTILKILNDLYTYYGYRNVAIWFHEVFESDQVNDDLIEFLQDSVECTNLDVSYSACITLCAILQTDMNASWSNILVKFILKIFQPYQTNNYRVQNYLTCFICAFASKSSTHRSMLITIFPEVIENIRALNSSGDRDLFVHPSRMAIFFTYVTADGPITIEKLKYGNAELSLVAIKQVLTNPYDEFLKSYTDMASYMDAKEWTDIAVVQDILNGCQEIVQVLTRAEIDADIIKAWKRLCRNSENRLASLNKIACEEAAETASAKNIETNSLTPSEMTENCEALLYHFDDLFLRMESDVYDDRAFNRTKVLTETRERPYLERNAKLAFKLR